jgi:GWxTD domain-containing protein
MFERAERISEAGMERRKAIADRPGGRGVTARLLALIAGLIAGLIATLALGCTSGGGSAGGAVPAGRAPAPVPEPGAGHPEPPAPPDIVTLYRRMGLLAEAGETPFVGSLSFFAGPAPDSSLIMLTVALSNHGLRFSREGDRYRAAYEVTLEVRHDSSVVRQLRSRETVRVETFRETSREDESVLYRQAIRLAPGTYDVRLTVRDETAARGSAVDATVGVPRFGDGSVSSPVPFYEATVRDALDSLPRVVATPRATLVFGRDSVVRVYAEGYGRGAAFPLRVAAEADGGSRSLWADSIALPRHGELFSGTFAVPVSRLGIGAVTLGVSRAGGADTVRVPLFVTFGEALPVASFADMLRYLEYFASPARLTQLRDASPDDRASLWAAFLRQTDPVPQTPQHEGLLDYFGRIAQANTRYRDEGIPGWLTDRGRVFVALGNPDQVLEPSVMDAGQRGRTMVWEYRRDRLQLTFVDETGFGQWRMTLGSETSFEAALRRVLIG